MASERVGCYLAHFEVGDVGFVVYHQETNGSGTCCLQKFHGHTNPSRLRRLEGWLGGGNDGGHSYTLGMARVEDKEDEDGRLLVRMLESHEIADALKEIDDDDDGAQQCEPAMRD